MSEEAILRRTLPNSREAEQSVIGSMLIDREGIAVASEAMNDRIHKFAVAIGLSEVKLREFMKHDISDGKFNEYGAFNNLIDSVDKCIAKAYFEQIEGHPIKMFRIPAKIDKAIRQFVLSGRDN